MEDVILSIQNLNVVFDIRGRKLTALKQVSLDLRDGECLSIVGDSGSGKSTLLRTIIGLLDGNGRIEGGTILYQGQNLVTLKDRKAWQQLRGSGITLIMQTPYTSLNPLRTVGGQIAESFLYQGGMSRRQAKEQACELMAEAGFTNVEKLYYRYPHELSGGMQQRIAIMACIACNPRVLLCDEPTASLDVTTQAQILKFIQGMCRKRHIASIIVTHDLGVVAMVADSVAVMLDGEVVEIGTVDEVFYDPRHPYTWEMFMSMPQLGRLSQQTRNNTPDKIYRRYALKIDRIAAPPYFSVSPTHKVKSWLLDPRAPKLEPPAVIRQIKDLE